MPAAPPVDERRTADFSRELRARAQSWIPSWDVAEEGSRDFGRALLEIAARFSSEVAERLDRAGEKMRLGFLDWLAVRGKAARPARMPVAFRLASTAQEAVRAPAPVGLQADAQGTSVVFETEKEVRIVPGELVTVVAVDADRDAFYVAPPGLADLKPLEPLPVEWRLKSFAAAGAARLQLEPDAGLAENLIVEADGRQYRIAKVDGDLVTIDPRSDTDLAAGTLVTKVATFSPFDGAARNWQSHALRLGDLEVLNIEGAATIEVAGASSLHTGYAWQYWGKLDPGDEVGWQALRFASPPIASGAIVLTKPKGSIEPRVIDGKNARWIRALTTSLAPGTDPFRRDELRIRVNASGCGTPRPCPPDRQTVSPAAEGMANTTPLVIEKVFFPLGREPRQFDAFYLGSKEAFSKKGAKVQLCFEMGAASFSALASARTGPFANRMLAGVAGDGYLHVLGFDASSEVMALFGNREPLRPPTPAPNGVAVAGRAVPLDPRPAFRPAVWAVGANVFAAASAGAAVWIWREDTDVRANSGWIPAGAVGPVDDTAAPVAGLVHLADGAAGQLFALRDTKLFVRDLNDADGLWSPVEVKSGGAAVRLTQVAPVAVVSGGSVGAGAFAEGLVAVDDAAKLYAVELAGTPTAGTCTKLLEDVAEDVAPAAVRRADGRLVAVAAGKPQAHRKLLGFLSKPSSSTKDDLADVDLDWPEITGNSIDVALCDGELTFALCLGIDAQSSAVAAWAPFDPAATQGLFTTRIPPQTGTAAGAPTLLPDHVVVPTSSSEVILARFDPGQRLALQAALETAVVTPASQPLLLGDQLAIPLDASGSTEYQLEPVAAAGVEHEGQLLYEFKVDSIDDDFFVYPAAAAPLQGTVDPAALDTLKIKAGDPDPAGGSVLLVTTDAASDLYVVQDYDTATRIATLDRALDVTDPTAPPAKVSYRVPEAGSGRLLPLLRLDPATNGSWSAALLDRTRLVFPGADPERQRGTAYRIDAGHPVLVALADHWTKAPADPGGGVKFVVDAAIGDWSRQLADFSSNPKLSWEYWNGTGWWALDPVRDDTLDFKQTGLVSFDVPRDLRESDWAGQTNYWIRARLIGGDYGKEKVTVTTTPVGDGKTEQTVERSTEGIRAPTVLKLHLSYALCDGVQPQFVVAEDSGSTRDQSDANRTPGAIVEAFVPLGVMLGRLSTTAPAPSAAEDCPPDCGRPGSVPGQRGASTSPAGAAQAPDATAAASGRAVLVGLSASPSEAPVNVLFLVDEKERAGAAPMTIEALVADRFVPVVADDATRALGESGLLSMAFADPPTPRELFGRTLTWLRLRPAASAAPADWNPTLRGAYLNAVWASARETLTRELVGSSDGAPNLTVTLARPPVLQGTLELRVKEPLGEEDRDALRQQDPNLVLTGVEGLPGDWVLWRQAIDPIDEPPDARVYALDERTGEIRFGDGLHGLIPPIGRDSIVAFKYQRTEPGEPGADSVPGNTISARTALNLVTPVESVEAVFSADQAAGGAASESPDRVLRFGVARLRHRERAVTARDIEDLALQTSPDLAQASAIVRAGRLRLVVVMRGRNPRPNAAQLRELRRQLLEAAPVALRAPGALRIEGPEIRRLRVELRLRIETLDDAGAVGQFVKEQLARLFDAATGGAGGDGWPLGASPSEEDVALALVDAPRLEATIDVGFREIVGTGEERPWPVSLEPAELAVLAADPVRIRFDTAEVTA